MSLTNNDYEPWTTDPVFNRAFAAVAANTLIDKQRLWELWTLVAQSVNVSGSIVEVGVCRGGSLALIGLAAEKFGFSESVFGFDTFDGCVLAGANDPLYKGGEHKADIADVLALLRSLSLDRTVKVVQGQFPKAAEHIALRPIRLAHIDVDTYQSAKECTEFIWPLLSVGGVIVYDDYGYTGTAGVTRYVDELWPRDGGLFIHNLNLHGILVRTK